MVFTLVRTLDDHDCVLPFLQGYHYCPGERVVNLTQEHMLDFTHEPLLFHLGRDPGEKYAME